MVISGSISTYAGAGFGDGASLLYFSPVINGFQFGVSYTPESGEEARSGNADNPEGNDVYSVGARYDGAFGDAGVAISVGPTQGVPLGPTAAVAMVPSMFNFTTPGELTETERLEVLPLIRQATFMIGSHDTMTTHSMDANPIMKMDR